MQNLETFLFGKLSHLKQFYKSEEEFTAHLKSGEVTIPIPDVIKYMEEFNEQSVSELAEQQLTEIVYALGCSRLDAISHALESQNAFEQITDDQIFNWLDTEHKDKLIAWQLTNKGKRAEIESN